jgi:hypothetical protein
MNWVLVPLRTQTYYPWDFWRRPYIVDQPSVRLHEVLYPAKERMQQAAEGLLQGQFHQSVVCSVSQKEGRAALDTFQKLKRESD